MASYIKKKEPSTDAKAASLRSTTISPSGLGFPLSPTTMSGINISEPFIMLPLRMDESFGLDLSLAQAVERLQDVMKENHQLKETLKENNQMLKSSQILLLQMKSKWEVEQTQTFVKFDQAKSIVMTLRSDVNTKKARIAALEQQIRNKQTGMTKPPVTLDDEQIVAGSSDLEQCRVNLSCIRKERDIQKKEMDNLHIQIEQMQKRSAETYTQLEQQKEMSRQLQDNCEHRESQMSQIIQQNKKLVESSKSLEQQKSKLVDVNTELEGRLRSGEAVDLKLSELRLTETEKSDNNLKIELEEERHRVTSLMSEMDILKSLLESAQHELETKSQSLDTLRDLMAGRVREIEILHLQKEGELVHQLDALHRRLQHQSVSSHSAENIETLKAQVMSLLNEVKESNARQQHIHALAENYKHKLEEVENRYTSTQEELHSLRSRDDHLIEALRSTVADTERALAKQKEVKDELNAVIEEYRRKLHEVQQTASTLKYQLDEYKLQHGTSQVSGSSLITMRSEEKRQQEEKLGHITAQLLTAEDSLLQKQHEIQTLQEKVMVLRSESENIPYIKAQRDSYKADFDTECRARQIDRQKLSELQEELETMRLFNQQLHDQLHQLSTLHRYGNEMRTVAPVVPPRGVTSPGGGGHIRSPPYPGGGYDECDHRNLGTPNYSSQGQRSPSGSSEGRTPSPQGQVSHRSRSREPSEHHDSTDTDTLTPALIEYKCPRCDVVTQDIDSMTIHVEDCLSQTDVLTQSQC